MIKFIKLLVIVSFLFVLNNAVAASKIKEIVVSGNQRIESSTVKEYLGFNKGDLFSAEGQNSAIKNLYATSLFETVSLNFSQGILQIDVKETPFVSKVTFIGNTKVKTAMLINEISTGAGESLRKNRVRADVEKIKEIYKRSGRFSVGVNAKIQLQQNNTAQVIFEITEGPKTGIKNIYFSGNENYSDSELKSIILTKESRWFRFLETNDSYDPDRIEHDKYLLSSFYNSVGFADFRMISVTADLLPTKEGFILTYSIEEGEKYNFGDISLVNKLSSIEDAKLKKFLPKKRGKTFNMSTMYEVAEKISNYLAGRGFPQVEVYPDIKADAVERVVNVAIIIDRADKVFINKINIDGNLKTEDRVIRNQFKIAEGDVFDRGKLQRGEQNIRNLDYFENLVLRISPTARADRYDIDINVEEKSTASIGLDIGYNSSGGPFGRISFLERNLLGTGKYLSAGAQIGRKNVSYNAGLTDPNFMDRDLKLGFSVFHSENGRGSGFSGGKQNYKKESTGGSVNFGYDITEDLSHDIGYSVKRDKLDGALSSTSVFIREQLGKYITSSVSHTLTYNKLDSMVVPKNGYILSLTQEFAGVGGDTKYLKHDLDTKIFKSFFENKYTLKLSGSAGDIRGLSGQKVRVSDRFNLGEYSLRGFSSGGVGPRDKVTGEGLGGQKYYNLSSELLFPSGLPKEFNVTGVLFADAGALWDADSRAATALGFHNDKSLRTSIGFGVVWVTRVAPIRLDWGFPINKKSYDEKQRFHIKFSTHF